LDRDAVKDITLNAGLNVLIFKVGIEPGRPARFSIRFTDAQGDPVKGITVTLDP
jgi:hypothetical protein